MKVLKCLFVGLKCLSFLFWIVGGNGQPLPVAGHTIDFHSSGEAKKNFPPPVMAKYHLVHWNQAPKRSVGKQLYWEPALSRSYHSVPENNLNYLSSKPVAILSRPIGKRKEAQSLLIDKM